MEMLTRVKHLPLHVDRAESLSSALRHIRRGGVDAVILDLTDSRSKQKESFLEIKHQAPNLPIILLAEASQKELALEFVQRGAQDYLVKGDVDVEPLFKTIRCAVERRRAEKRARQSLERENATIHQILEFAPVGIVRLSRELQIREANSAFIDSLGIPHDTIGRNICDVVPGLTPGSFHESIASEQPVRLSQYEIRPHGKDESERRYFNMVIWPTKRADVVTGFVLISEDISDHVKVAAQRDEFIATLAHDMKVPLAGAERYLHNVLSGALGEVSTGLKQGLSALRRSNKQLLWMVHNLLFAYQEQEGVDIFAPSLSNVSEILNECVQDLMPFAESKSIDLSFSSSTDLPLAVLDRLAIRRMVLNFLDNAIKCTDNGGKVTVAARTDEGELFIEVSDTGKGIAKELLPTLFQRFWKEPGTFKASGSAGLGLYVCRKIAEGHGGTISCESDKSRGTIFTVAIPLKEI